MTFYLSTVFFLFLTITVIENDKIDNHLQKYVDNSSLLLIKYQKIASLFGHKKLLTRAMATTCEAGTSYSGEFNLQQISYNSFLQLIFPLTFINAIGTHQKFNQFMTISIHFRSKWCGNFPLSAGKFYFQENL